MIQQPLRTLRRPEVLRRTGLSRTTIHNLEAAGDFPRHRMLTPRCAVWVEHEVEDWLRTRLEHPSAPAPVPGTSSRRVGQSTHAKAAPK